MLLRPPTPPLFPYTTLFRSKTAPALARPYKTWGYPLTPIVFIAFAIWLVYNTMVETPKDSAIGAGLILLGLPGYYYWRRDRKSTRLNSSHRCISYAVFCLKK